MNNFKKILMMLIITFSLGRFSIAMEESMNLDDLSSCDEMEIDDSNPNDKFEEFYSDEDSEDKGFFADIKNGNIDEVKKALKKGINPNSKNSEGETALSVACNYRQTEIVKLLLEHKDIKADKRDDGCKPYKGSTPLMGTLLFIEGKDKIRMAKALEIVQMLLDKVEHPKDLRLLPGLCHHITKELKPIIRELFRRCHEDEFRKSLLYTAIDIANNRCKFGLEILQMLIKKGFDVNKKEGTYPLIISPLFIQNKKMVKTYQILLNSDIDLSATDDNGKTVLMHVNDKCSKNPDNEDFAVIRQMILKKLAS